MKLIRKDHPAIGKKCKACGKLLAFGDDCKSRQLTDKERDAFGRSRDTSYQIGPGGYVIHVSCRKHDA